MREGQSICLQLFTGWFVAVVYPCLSFVFFFSFVMKGFFCFYKFYLFRVSKELILKGLKFLNEGGINSEELQGNFQNLMEVSLNKEDCFGRPK